MNALKFAIFAPLAIIFMISTIGCTQLDKIYDPSKGLLQSDDTTLFNRAQAAMANGGYSNAARYYEMLESKYPFSDKLPQAYLDIIYAYYASGDSAGASASADRYTHLYPRSPNVDYAYYMKALSNYDRSGTLSGRYLALDPAWRDLGPLHESYDGFAYLINRFPDSQYVPDAKKHMIYLRNTFAQHEINVANFYMASHAYVAAANRANYVLKTYPQAPQAQAALKILERANSKLGLKDAVKDAKRVEKLTYGTN